MAFNDLRRYLADLEAHGELRTIKTPVSTEIQLGAIARLACETYGPAALFENLVGYPTFRGLAAFETYSGNPDNRAWRLARALGLSDDTTGDQIVDFLAGFRDTAGVAPVLVETGPVHENIVRDRGELLDYLPIPHLHPGDGGPYVNTIGFFVLESPDRSWVNWAVARCMKLDGDRMVGMTAVMQHIGMLRREWDKIGTSVPFALVLGADPITTLISGGPLAKFGASEGDIIGAIRGEPLEVVECVTSSLRVPAHAEIVIEGYIDLTESADEGPMAEYHGYIDKAKNTTGAPDFGVYHITAVTHRNDAIYPSTCAGKPVDEDHTITGPGVAAASLNALRAASLPVEKAWMVPESASHVLAVTVSDGWSGEFPDANELCRKIGNAVKMMDHSAYWVQRILVTDNDIDPTSPSDLWWAYATRCRPGDDSIILEDVPIMALSPIVNTREERTKTRGRVEVLNCLIPPYADDLSVTSAALRQAYPHDAIAFAERTYLGE